MAEPDYIPANPDPREQRSDPARNLAVAVYILQALAFFLGGVTALAGVILNYLKLDDVRGTWIERHFRWQIRTFWIALLWGVIGMLTVPLIIGWFILLGTSIWAIYRIVKGALALNEGKPV
ncbi:DUF4870 family protein [Marinobacter lutaoensis]|uniref:Transmembrane protein n=1 Tax=Marinobacter lutaoensis TaxID=135739 RepID=A0A1V2DQN2_9GAMM|nr:hypothetical protein [Marinobacter lutaoensis]NVD36108.1 hypothetical protein [Marinobacter lutaoensis]ONF42964.1 hypothetical protein BTO32_09690 [Marinobacter lutaoensis]